MATYTRESVGFALARSQQREFTDEGRGRAPPGGGPLGAAQAGLGPVSSVSCYPPMEVG